MLMGPPKLSGRAHDGGPTAVIILEAPAQLEDEEFHPAHRKFTAAGRETLQEVTNNLHNHHSHSEQIKMYNKSPKRLISIDDTASVKFVHVSSRTSLRPGEPGSSTNQEEDLHTYFNNS